MAEASRNNTVKEVTMMDNNVLKKSRHIGESYKVVLEKDPVFCQLIREAAEKNEYHPADEDFGYYLIAKHEESKNVPANLCEQGSTHFVKAMTTAMREEFHDLVDHIEITETRKVHPECKLEHTNGFLGIFYRYFIKKCVFNIRDEDGYNTYVERYATIFPFEVKLDVRNRDVIRILKVLHDDEKFRKRTRDFLNAHFDDVQFDVVDAFLSNIFRVQRESSLNAERLLQTISKNGGTPPPIEGNGNRFRFFHQRKPSLHLKNFPRLNKEGAKRFLSMYEAYEDITRANANPKYTSSYFTNLPETNFYELFTLLDCEFFRRNFETYAERFHKYLFFFVGASKCIPNPVFFIDDYLFECLKRLQKFKKSRLPASKLIHDLRMITLVHRRKLHCDWGYGTYYQVDHRHLEHIENYIESFCGIETAKIEYEIPNPSVLACGALLCLDDATVDIRFSKERHGAKVEFWEGFLMAALCDLPIIKRLVLYNAFLGTEYTVRLDERFNREGIRKFVRKYNSWDFSTVVPFEKLLTWGWEDCYVEGSIDWENQKKDPPKMEKK